MILVDTSVWVDHFRVGESVLSGLLERDLVLIHPFVTGELAMGNLKNRSEILGLLGDLPGTAVATDAEVLHLVENRHLMGKGIGYVDAHLLASTTLTPGTLLWTRDMRLWRAAIGIAVSYEERESGS